jgi:hypothetical protein
MFASSSSSQLCMTGLMRWWSTAVHSPSSSLSCHNSRRHQRHHGPWFTSTINNNTKIETFSCAKQAQTHGQRQRPGLRNYSNSTVAGSVSVKEYVDVVDDGDDEYEAAYDDIVDEDLDMLLLDHQQEQPHVAMNATSALNEEGEAKLALAVARRRLNRELKEEVVSGQYRRAKSIIRAMHTHNIVPDLPIFTTIMLLHCREHNVRGAMLTYSNILQAGLQPTASVYAMLLRTLRKVRMFSQANSLANRVTQELIRATTTSSPTTPLPFTATPSDLTADPLSSPSPSISQQQHEAIRPNAHLCGELLALFTVLRDDVRILSVMNLMKHWQIKPTHQVYTTLLHHHALCNHPVGVRRTLDAMRHAEMEICSSTVAVILGMYGRLGSLEPMLQWFSRIRDQTPSLLTPPVYATLVRYCGELSRPDIAFILARQMLGDRHTKPTMAFCSALFQHIILRHSICLRAPTDAYKARLKAYNKWQDLPPGQVLNIEELSGFRRDFRSWSHAFFHNKYRFQPTTSPVPKTATIWSSNLKKALNV